MDSKSTHMLMTLSCISTLTPWKSTVKYRSWSRVENIGWWICANQLKLNQDKTLFIWLGTPHQLSKIQLQTITLEGVDISISTEAMCLGVLFDSPLTFAPYARCLSGESFYHLRQIKTVRKSLSEDAAKTMVHAFVSSRLTTVTVSSTV